MAESTNSNSDVSNDEVPGQIKVIWCKPCVNKNKQTTAKTFCSTCDEYQCVDCSQVHYTYAFMKEHKLVNADQAEKKQVSFNPKGLDQCSEHQKAIEFFCEDKNQLWCSMCAINGHRKCKSVVDIQKVVRRPELNYFRSKIKLEEVEQKAEIIINSVVTSKEKMDVDVKGISVKITRMRDKVLKMFEDLEVVLAKDAKSLQTETIENLTKKQSQAERYLADLQSCKATIEDVYQNGTSVQQFIVEHRIEEEVNDLQKKVDAGCKSLETITVSFEFDATLQLPPLPILDYVPVKLSFVSQLKDAPIKLAPTISIKLKQKKDDLKEPLITGVDFLPDGRLVAVDNFNKRCLVYDEKLRKIGSYQLHSYPLSVVVVSEDEVAITSNRLYILRVNKSNDISLEQTYTVTTNYNSICLKDDTHFVVGTYNHSTPVRRLSFTGDESDFNINFPNKSYRIGTSSCTYIRNNDKVVLTDKAENSVYIYDLKTKRRVVVKNALIKEPRGVAVGLSDTILVCCQTTNSIVQISQTGRVLTSHKLDMTNPTTICVSPDKSFLVVANTCTGAAKLQKFKISY